MLPRLHVVTDSAILSRHDFDRHSSTILRVHGAALALHVRGHGIAGARLFRIATELQAVARESGAVVIVNDRVDVALAVHCGGVQIGRRSLPVQATRKLVGDMFLGYSAHSCDEAATALRGGADYCLLGSVWATPTHARTRLLGLTAIAAAATLPGPVIGIGGVTPERARKLVAAGAHGAAVIRGIWSARDPVAAVAEYMAALEPAHGSPAGAVLGGTDRAGP